MLTMRKYIEETSRFYGVDMQYDDFNNVRNSSIII